MFKIHPWCAALAMTLPLGVPAVAQSKSGEPWGARAPAQCQPLKQSQPPTAAQAAQLLRCARERGSESSGELWLMEDIQVEIARPTTFVVMYQKIIMADADTTKPVYPIRGSWTWSVCKLRKDAGLFGQNPDLNCQESEVTGATGGCWITTFDDWKCTMNGQTGSAKPQMRPRAQAAK